MSPPASLPPRGSYMAATRGGYGMQWQHSWILGRAVPQLWSSTHPKGMTYGVVPLPKTVEPLAGAGAAMVAAVSGPPVLERYCGSAGGKHSVRLLDQARPRRASFTTGRSPRGARQQAAPGAEVGTQDLPQKARGSKRR